MKPRRQPYEIYVDTDSLIELVDSDFKLTKFDERVVDLTSAAAKALTGNTDPRLRALALSLPVVSAKPISEFTRPLPGSSWHNGEFVESYYIDAAEKVLKNCDLTSNERERLDLARRRLSSKKYIVYALATSRWRPTNRSDKLPSAPVKLDLLGLVGLGFRLRPGTIATVAKLESAGHRIYYISTDRASLTTEVGYMSGLLPKSKLPPVFTGQIDPNVHCYYSVSADKYRTFTEQLDPQTSIVTNQPLTTKLS